MESDEPLYSDDGVDLTLIRWALAMTPAQRLDALQGMINAIVEIRELNGLPGNPKDVHAA